MIRMYFLDWEWITLAREVVRVSDGRLGSDSLSASGTRGFLALSVCDVYSVT